MNRAKLTFIGLAIIGAGTLAALPFRQDAPPTGGTLSSGLSEDDVLRRAANDSTPVAAQPIANAPVNSRTGEPTRSRANNSNPTEQASRDSSWYSSSDSRAIPSHGATPPSPIRASGNTKDSPMETGEGGSAIAHLDGDSELSSSPVPKLDSTPHERPSVSAPAVPVPRSDPTAIASNGYNDLASSDAVEDRETTGVPPIDREMSAVTGNDGAAAAPLQAIPRFARRPTEGVSATSPATGAIESRRRKHRIADGDTLPSIAQRYLRDPSRWTEIYSLNRDLLDNPELLPIGAEIRLPEKQSQHPIGGEMQAASPSASASSGLVESDNRPSYEASEPLAPIPSGLFKSNPSPPEGPFTGNDDVKDDLSTSAAPSHVKPAEAKSDQSSGESTASTVDPK